MSKMVTVEIEIPEDTSTYIESLQYELNARKDLLAFMIDRGQNETPGFQKYHQEYMEFSAQYEMAKNEMAGTYIVPKYGKDAIWNLDFRTRIATVQYTGEVKCTCGCGACEDNGK